MRASDSRSFLRLDPRCHSFFSPSGVVDGTFPDAPSNDASYTLRGSEIRGRHTVGISQSWRCLVAVVNLTPFRLRRSLTVVKDLPAATTLLATLAPADLTGEFDDAEGEGQRLG